MTLSVEIKNSVGNEWNQNLLRSSYSTSFQTSQWCDLYKNSFQSKPFFIIIKDESGKIVGQLATLLHKNYNWRDSNLTKFVGKKMNLGLSLEWERGPIIHNDKIMEEISKQIFLCLDKICVSNNVSNIRGTSPTNSNISQFPFSKIDLIKIPWSTYIIKLKNKDELFNSFDKKTRYDIRKSEKSNLEFTIVKEKSDFIDYVKLKLNSTGNIGLKNYPDFFDHHWKLLHANQLEHLFVAKFEGEIVSGILCSTFNGNMIQHALANSPEKDLVGTFLTWNTIKWAQKMKFKTFDFAGVDPLPKTKKEKGIYFYAEKFGGKKINFFSYSKILNQKKYYLTSGLQNPKRIISKYQSYKDKKIIKNNGSK